VLTAILFWDILTAPRQTTVRHAPGLIQCEELPDPFRRTAGSRDQSPRTRSSIRTSSGSARILSI
jgi:hypothetical protein